MDFAPIIADVKAAKCAGFRYQRAGHQRYRDRVTVYRDGRLLFERFCYGEAAGLVFKLWAPARTIPACLNGIFQNAMSPTPGTRCRTS